MRNIYSIQCTVDINVYNKCASSIVQRIEL